MKKQLLFMCALFTAQVLSAQCWEQVSSGPVHTIAIKDDGTLWSWGTSLYGELGLGEDTDADEPQQVGTDNKWVYVATNDQTSFGIKSDGTLWGWGYNAEGQVGDGTNADRNIPIQIGTDTNWQIVSAGGLHTIALKNDGTLWAWGDNEVRQSGNPANNDDYYTPTQIGTDSNWKEISTGSFHSLAVKTDGTLWAWGNQGGSGNYNMTQIGTSSDWDKVIGGYFFSAALKADGTLWTWGNNTMGQLGQGNTDPSNVSTPVMVGTSTWKEIASDWHDMYGIKGDGTLWKWGQNMDGGEVLYAPTLVSAATSWEKLTLGQWFGFAQKDSGNLWGWGRNDFGRLGTTSISWDTITLEPVIIMQCATAGLNSFQDTYFSVYPNPAASQLFISSTHGFPVDVLNIYDTTGKVVHREEDGDEAINIEHLSPGMYFIEISSNDSLHRQKFIKQ